MWSKCCFRDPSAQRRNILRGTLISYFDIQSKAEVLVVKLGLFLFLSFALVIVLPWFSMKARMYTITKTIAILQMG